jgi:Fe-S cluster assembly iron-binding protein IscA
MDARGRERLGKFVIAGAGIRERSVPHRGDGVAAVPFCLLRTTQYRQGGFAMLKVTDSATTLLAEARASAGAPDNFGVRFFLAPKDDGPPKDESQLQITFRFVEGPEPADEVVTEEELGVYVAPEAAEAIGDATLDAQGDEGANLRLVLRR